MLVRPCGILQHAFSPQSTVTLRELASLLPRPQLILYCHAFRLLPAIQPQVADTEDDCADRQVPSVVVSLHKDVVALYSLPCQVPRVLFE